MANSVQKGVIWLIEAFAFVLLAVRLTSRLRSHRRLFWDDGLLVFAWVLTLITAALWQCVAATMYWTIEIGQGTAQLTVSLEDYFEKLKLWLRVTFLASIFFYTSLTAVKLSFLLFFRRLGDRVYGFKWYWWPTLVFVLCTWIIGVGTTGKEAECMLPKDLEFLFYNCQATTFTSFDTAVIKTMCVLDVVSDFFSQFALSCLLSRRYRLTFDLVHSRHDTGGTALECQDASA